MERLEQQHAQHMDKYSGSGNEMKGLGFSAAGAATITTGCSIGWTCMMLVAVLFNRLIRIERTRFRQQGSSTRKKPETHSYCTVQCDFIAHERPSQRFVLLQREDSI